MLVHELVFVGDVQEDDGLADNRFAELLPQPAQVALLHYEDHIGPAQQPGRDADAGARLGAGRADLMPGVAIEDALGREAAELVAATDEEEVREGSYSSTPLLRNFRSACLG